MSKKGFLAQKKTKHDRTPSLKLETTLGWKVGWRLF